MVCPNLHTIVIECRFLRSKDQIYSTINQGIQLHEI